jgi:hypothetical protein
MARFPAGSAVRAIRFPPGVRGTSSASGCRLPAERTNRAKFGFVDRALMIFSDPTLTVAGKGIGVRKLENNQISPKIPDLMKFAWAVGAHVTGFEWAGVGERVRVPRTGQVLPCQAVIASSLGVVQVASTELAGLSRL